MQENPTHDQVASTSNRTLLAAPRWTQIAAALRLSPRELQITQCIFDGQKEARIATELGISAHTVHTHVKRLYRKLGVADQRELVVRVFAAYLALPGPPT